MSDAGKDATSAGNRMSLEDLERDIAAKAPPSPPPAAAAKAPTATPPGPRPGGGLLGGTALLLALGAVGLSGYGLWRDWTAASATGPDLSPLLARIATVEAQQQQLRGSLDALSKRQAQLEDRLDQAGNLIAAAPAPVPMDDADDAPQAPAATMPAPVRDAALEARVAALEDQKPVEVDLEPLTKRVQTLEAVTAEIIPRLTMLETRRQMGAVGESMIIAVGQLQAALAGGRPYARELRAAQALAANDTALLDLLAPLAATAETGLAGDIELREKFRLLAPAVLRADRDREGADWKERVLGRLSNVITLRRASGEVAGDDAESVLARAEAGLMAGDLPRAVEEMEKLPPHAAAPAAEWLKLAEARMAAEATAATLADLSLSRMTGTGTGTEGR